jgi:hypothetical protein
MLRRARYTPAKAAEAYKMYMIDVPLPPVGRSKAKESKVNPLKFFYESPQTRRFDKEDFWPEQTIPATTGVHCERYNTFDGFAYAPQDLEEVYDNDDELEPLGSTPFYDHLYRILCDGNDDAYLHVVKCVALMYQKPTVPWRILIILAGIEGCGKGPCITMHYEKRT